jgi:uncharacterized protein (TIGR02246 family)
MRAIISFSFFILLSASDREAVTRVYDQYVAAWLAGDADAVMRLLSDDAVLIPHHGLAPVVGASAIRKWWWPPDSPPMTINVFTVTYDQVGGSGQMAFVRGTQKLEWTTGTKRSRNRGNHLTLFRKEPDGRWLITHQMWGDPANETVN